MKTFKEFVTEVEEVFGDISSLRITYPNGTMSKWRKVNGKFYAVTSQLGGAYKQSQRVAKIKSTKALHSGDKREESKT